MRIARVFFLCSIFIVTSCQHPTPPAVEPPYQKPASFDVQGSRTLGKIDRLDPKLDELLAPDAKLEKLAEGFDWSEGPIWIKKGAYLLFSDVPQNVVYRWKEGEKVTEFLKPTLVDRYQGKRFNSPNDLVYHSNGDLYFTDPPYGLEGKNDDPKKEIPFNGVYRLKPGGDLTLLTDKLTFPNGLAFSPDEKVLYVAVSDPKKAIWMSYDVKEDGTIANGRVFFDSTKWVTGKNGLPDGMKVDAKGNLWATGPGGVLIFSPDGKHLGTIKTGEATANCNWGNDGTVLYVTADMYLCRIQTRTRGAKF
jgi:gluconolactonase